MILSQQRSLADERRMKEVVQPKRSRSALSTAINTPDKSSFCDNGHNCSGDVENRVLSLKVIVCSS